MISTELHREVPQYMASPWLITWVMARTVSSKTGAEERHLRPGFGQFYHAALAL